MSTEYGAFKDEAGSTLTVSEQHGQLNLWLEPSVALQAGETYNFRLAPEDLQHFVEAISAVQAWTETEAGRPR